MYGFEGIGRDFFLGRFFGGFCRHGNRSVARLGFEVLLIWQLNLVPQNSSLDFCMTILRSPKRLIAEERTYFKRHLSRELTG